jgi:peptidoglycan/LPS O-acetylase OafA/YrhL
VSDLAGQGRTPYRPDIDGLRALSVIAVILFHAELPMAAGGFVGVDVFFVISGYLITQWLLARGGASPRALLREFYLRRARRILPALVLMLAVTAAVAWVLLLPADLVRHGMYLLAAVFMGGNFAAWTEGDYFNMAVGFAPLLHLWSIAVEEQFYLLFPLLMLVLRRFPPARQLRVLAAIALISFVVCVAGSWLHPVANFYFGFTRAWELLLGAVLAYGAWDGLAQRRATLLAAGGLMAILAAMLFFRRDLHHPGLSTLLPTLGTAAFIAAGRAGQTRVGRIFSLRPFVITGQASYSLYLWHLPALVFMTYVFVLPPRGWQLAAVLAGSALIAFAAWAGFEQPLRRARWLPRTRDFVTASLVALWLLAVVGMTWLRSDGYPQRFQPDEVRILDSGVFHHDARRCMSLPVRDIAAGRLCRYGPANAAPRALLWGDSHALALLPAFESLAGRERIQVYFAGRSTCRPLAGLPERARCDAFNGAMREAVTKVHPDVVILAAFWAYPDFEFEGAAGGVRLTFSDALRATTRELGSLAPRICLVRDVPALRHRVPHGLIMLRRRGSSTEFLTQFDPVWREPQRTADDALVAFARESDVILVDPKSALCTTQSCRIESDGQALFRDSNHLSVIGAAYVADSLAGCFENLR